jgi:hypothetical protein
MLGVLGLKIILIEDEAATARTLAQRIPVISSNQRFGNKSNCKTLLKIESAETVKIDDHTYGAHGPVPLVPAPPPVSRAHLRVVQSKRGSKYG